MHTIITDYSTHQTEIRRVRDEVFLIEQQISREDEVDDRDLICKHALSFVDSTPVGTGRIDIEKDGKIGRVAVLKEFRRMGIGKSIMSAFEQYAKEAGLPKIWFHAQLTAVPFYLQLGYQKAGPEFEEANIIHIKMEKEFG